MVTPINLAAHARQVYSGAGEDGIIGKIFSLLGEDAGVFVEFGAWDGQRLSNTKLLIERGWTGFLIEGDVDKFAALTRNVTAPAVRLIHAFVETGGENSLNAILGRAQCPPVIDLLSIDIDSDDLAVWMSLDRVRARCVIIEYNPSIPFDTHFVNPKGRSWGNSALTITHFAKSRGYALVAMTDMNLIFLDRQDMAAAGILEIALDVKYVPNAPRYFWGYDGTLLSGRPLEGAQAPEFFRVPWHHYVFAQPMPKFLRRWKLGGEWKFAERLTSGIVLLLSRPFSYLRHRTKQRNPARRKE